MPVESTTFGRTGATVSRLGFGGAPAGLTNYLDTYSPKDSKQRDLVVAAVRRGVELGVTYFDTAAGYGDGASERIFGEALEGRCEGLFLATKVGPHVENPRASIEHSLENLRVDTLDLVQIHGSSYDDELATRILAPGGLLEILEQARDEGLIRFIGFTTENQNGAVDRFIRSGRFDAMQICYNLLFQHPYEATRPFGAIYDADQANLGVVTMRTLTSGMFQKWMRWVRPDDDFDYSPGLLQFVLSNPLVDVALVGMRSPEEVEQNVAILQDLGGRIDVDALHKKYP